MSAFFWLLFGVNAVFAGLVTLALPHGQNFVYALMAGSMLGMIWLLARSRVEPRPRMGEHPREWDHS